MKLIVINFDRGQTWWMNALVNHHKVCWICIEKKCVNCVMFSHSKGFFSSLCNAWAKSHYFLILLSCWKFWGFRRLRGGQAWILKRRHNQATLPRPRLAPADHRPSVWPSPSRSPCANNVASNSGMLCLFLLFFMSVVNTAVSLYANGCECVNVDCVWPPKFCTILLWLY